MKEVSTLKVAIIMCNTTLVNSSRIRKNNHSKTDIVLRKFSKEE